MAQRGSIHPSELFLFWKIQYNVVIKKKEKRTFKEAKLKLAQASQGSLSEIPQNRQLSS